MASVAVCWVEGVAVPPESVAVAARERVGDLVPVGKALPVPPPRGSNPPPPLTEGDPLADPPPPRRSVPDRLGLPVEDWLPLSLPVLL